MRKMTLFIALILSASVWAFHDFKSGDCYYNIVSNTPPYTVKVAQGWQMYDGSWGIIPYSGDIVIPDSVVYNNICYSVVAIQDFIFNGCPALTSVKVGNNIHTIGKHAFSSNPRLKKVVLPETLTTIGDEAFIQCDSLHTINIPSSLTTTGKNLFDDCPSLDTVIWNVRENISFTHFQSHKNISHLIIGDSATIIPESAFSGCSNLTTIDFGSNLKTIGRSAFFNTGLRSVILPEGVDSIAHAAFYNCDSLKVVSIPSTVRRIYKEENLINAPFSNCHAIDSVYWNAYKCIDLPFTAGYSKRIRVVEFGDSIKHIPSSFCYGFDSLTTIIYPNHLQSIGKQAFYDCNNLSSVMILDSVSTIGESAFSGCSNLTTIDFGKNLKTIGKSAFSNTGLRSVILPEGVDSIAHAAFYSCDSLKVVSIPSTVRRIYKDKNYTNAPFSNCHAIDSVYWNAYKCIDLPFTAGYSKRIRVVEFGDSIKHIPSSFCYGFDSLTTIIYPNHLQSIGKQAFYDCNNLSSVMILDSVSTIGESAFSGCSNLDTVNVHALTPPALGNKAFNSLPLCFIPCGTLEAYQNSVWKSQVGSIEEVCEWHDGTSCETAIPIHWQDSIMLPINNEVWYQVNLNSAIAAGQDILWRVFNPQLSGRDSNPVTLSIEVYADCSSVNDTLYYAQTEIQPQSNISTLFDYTEHLLETQEYVYVRFKTSAFWNFDENLILSADFAKHTELEQNCDDIAIRRVGEFYDSEEITPTDDWYGLDFSLFEENAKGCFMIISNKSMDSVSVSIDGFLSCSAIEPTYSYIGDLSPEETIVMPFDYTPFDICYLHAVSTGDVVIQWVSNKCGEHLYWDYQNENKHLTITGYGEMDNFFLAGPWGYLNVTSVSLPDGITHIGNFAFFMSNLSYISFPSTVESIGLAAFGGCQSLQSANIPQSVKMIDGTAFTGCGALQSIIVESANTMYDSRNDCNAIIHTESDSLVVGCINTIIPESIVKIGENAFANIAEPSLDTSIVHTSLKIPQNVISIGASAFVNTYFDTLYVEALTPPAIDSTTFNTFPVCYVSCGTLEAYQNSDWATYMESIEEYNQTQYAEESVIACDSYTWNGETYTQGGEYVYTTVAANGCDSIVTLHLTINQSEHVEFSMTACDSYEWHGMTYTISGDYTYNTTTDQGCERVEVLHLTINKSEYVEESVTACDSYEWNGIVYTESGNYTYNTTTEQGCERVEVLHLTINKSEYVEESVTACDSYEWHGVVYTESGDYTYTTTTDQGCERVEVLHLTINKSEYVETSVTACDSYDWNGVVYTESGDYTYTTTTDQGCERVEVLHLTINKSEYVETSVTACDSYDWNGVVYTESGDYTYNTTTDQGCERVEVLHLTILPDAMTESEELALCPSELPYEWYGQWLTEAGSYTAIEQYAGMECDSVIHELTVNVYVQTLPAAVTLPIVRTGEAIDVSIPTAEIQAHIAAETWYAPNAEVAWYIMENSDWAALTTEPVAAGTTQVVLKYAVATDCGNIESDNMVIDVIPTSVENTSSQSPTSDCQKILYEDHIYILRDGKIYSIMGQEM